MFVRRVVTAIKNDEQRWSKKKCLQLGLGWTIFLQNLTKCYLLEETNDLRLLSNRKKRFKRVGDPKMLSWKACKYPRQISGRQGRP